MMIALNYFLMVSRVLLVAFIYSFAIVLVKQKKSDLLTSNLIMNFFHANF